MWDDFLSGRGSEVSASASASVLSTVVVIVVKKKKYNTVLYTVLISQSYDCDYSSRTPQKKNQHLLQDESDSPESLSFDDYLVDVNDNNDASTGAGNIESSQRRFGLDE